MKVIGLGLVLFIGVLLLIKYNLFVPVALFLMALMAADMLLG